MSSFEPLTREQRDEAVAIRSDLTTTQAASELNCAMPTLWRLLNAKKLDAYRVGRELRIRRESLDTYKKAHRYVPRSEGEQPSELGRRLGAASVTARRRRLQSGGKGTGEVAE